MSETRERPIIFSSPMVQAILAGAKTETRRVVTKTPTGRNRASYGARGDLLWVKETFVIEDSGDYTPAVPGDGRPYREETVHEGCYEGLIRLMPHYRATESEPHIVPLDLPDDNDDRTRWTSARYMPRWASRILLGVVEVMAERLQDITDEGARAEGFSSREDFATYWDSLSARRGYSWQSNSRVWVIRFKRLETREQKEVGRESIGVDISEDYRAQVEGRLGETQGGLY